MIRPTLAALLLLTATPTVAEPPRVVTDIPPVQSITAAIMGDLGTPELVVDLAGSPHHLTLRPSDAARLNDADLLIWVGPDLTPWLEDARASVTNSLTSLTLANADGWTPLPFREIDDFKVADDHDHDHDDHDHDDHAHDHGETDPHAWLDPRVATAWANAIAAALSDTDPANADAYRANAATFANDMAALEAELATRAEAIRGVTYLLPHDAYQYFEVRFDLPAAGTITFSDDADPGPAYIAGLQDLVRDGGIDCVTYAPYETQGWVTLLTEGTEVAAHPLDQLGADLPRGPDLYPDTLRAIMTTLETCAGQGS